MLRVRELDGYERQCVMCGRVPERDLEAARAAALDAGRYSGKSRRREPSRRGERL